MDSAGSDGAHAHAHNHKSHSLIVTDLVPEVRHPALYASQLADLRKVHSKVSLQHVSDARASTSKSGRAWQIPVAALEARLMEDMSHRAALGGKDLPSAIFFTFLNTHQTLTCMSFSGDGSCIAGMPLLASSLCGCFHGL